MVIVIIGLIVAGVVGGQSLVQQAKLRSVLKEFNDYTVATNTFKLEYNNLPGDMPNAVDYWGQAAAGASCKTTIGSGTQTCNGDGNKRISQYYANSNESFRYWQHLLMAGLVSGEYTGIANSANVNDVVFGLNAPESVFSGAGWVASSNFGYIDGNWFGGNKSNIFYYGAKDGSNGSAQAPLLTPSQAYSLDNKIDDGMAGLGSLITWKQGGAVNPNCATTNVEETAQYDISRSTVECSLVFRNMF